MSVKKCICSFCTTVNCGVDVYVEGNRILKAEADTSCLINPGTHCPRMGPQNPLFAAEYFHSPYRLDYPMKRIGERGSGKWEQLSWKLALDEIAERLSKIKEDFGAEAVASVKGTGRTTQEWARMRFMNLFGSPNNVGILSVCFLPSAWPDSVTFGFWPMIYSVPETQCITYFGGNCAESTPVSWDGTVKFKKKFGTKLIAADPRFSESARNADSFLPLRPGTDGALLLAWLNVIINEELYDKRFVDKWCYGFDKLKEHVQKYTPEWADKVTGVPKEKIIDGARMYARNRPACSYHGNAPEAQGRNVFDAVRTKSILKAITGNLDVEGGEVMVSNPEWWPGGRALELYDELPREQRKKQLGASQFRLKSVSGYEAVREAVTKVWGQNGWPPYHETIDIHPYYACEAILNGKPYPMRAWLVFGSNPMVSLPNTKHVYKALKALDLLIVADYVWTPTAQLADYILPSACCLESPQTNCLPIYGIHNMLVAGEAAVPRNLPGEYERLHDMEIWRELGVRLEQEKYWPWKNLEEFLDWRFKDTPYGSFKEFMDAGRYVAPPVRYRKYEKTGFGTPTGKVECYSTICEKFGYNPLPEYQEPAESPISTPMITKEYPLILTTGARFLPMHHSEFRQVKSARKATPDPIIEIHAETARKYGISEGDWIWIETRRGRIKQRAHLTTGILPNVVHVQHGWWYPELPGEEPWLHGVWESNANVLTDNDPDTCDQKIGSWSNRAMLCKVYKVKSWWED